MAEVSKGYSLTHAYKFFKEKHNSTIDKETYRKVCYAFNKIVMEDALAGKMVKLPHRMGSIWCKKYKVDPDKLYVDLNESKKAGKVIYHMNFHSDGFQARWAWSKRNNLVTNMIYYSFSTTRNNSRALAKIMKEPDGHKRYFT